MPNPPGKVFDVGGPKLPGFGALRSRIGRIAIAFVVLLALWWSVVSIPTGHVGVLTLFGKVTGEVLSEGIHVINPLKSVQKLSVQTQSVKESASVPSNEGTLALSFTDCVCTESF